mmetsp:Transcript_18737/g.45039  ORF Transcript_18737/g.45039 Transcript_18737/m.45039 type:complete len:131 (+) Transcript_18737:321-713(+)
MKWSMTAGLHSRIKISTGSTDSALNDNRRTFIRGSGSTTAARSWKPSDTGCVRITLRSAMWRRGVSTRERSPTDHNESNDGPHSCTAANDHEKDGDAIEINDASSSCLDRVLVDDGGDLADTGTPSRNYT